jgi:cytochrome c-type biogenesis protein CcmF
MKFEGEHLLPGQLGHFFVILGLIASGISAFAYFRASRIGTEKEIKEWNVLGNWGFIAQAISLIIVFSSIFYICSHHFYEYMYAYKHASKELEYKYLLACIWEGQEGSFLLWAIWHAVLGSFILFRGKQWKAPVLSIISVAQFCLFFMILGVYIGDVRLGNSPFTLTRNELAAPIFSQPDYLKHLVDGMGLNVLLRNYWMVIHPPVLFLGFASTIIPFAYGLSALVSKRYTDWVKPALPWTLLSICVLGVGIMMGGKWAYESLSFGGYWAWDPVENASLVPWLILVAGLHTMLIYNATGHSLRATFFFCLMGFVFVLYSTFLTRTGILGDSSVHAFTEAGKAINVMIGLLVAIFTLPALVFYFVRYKNIPAVYKEEATSSREFWMFIGSLVLFLTSIFIIAKTSLPVYNKIFGTSIANPADAEFSYNKVVVMVAFMLGILSGISQYLKYRTTGGAYFFRKISIPSLVAIGISTLVFLVYPINFYKHGIGFLVAIYVALFASIYSVITNGWYIWSGLKGKWRFAGGSLAHAGFALMIAGMLISSGNKKVISSSLVNGINMPVSQDPMTKQQDDPLENLTLLRDVPTTMGDYSVTYKGKKQGHEKDRRFYQLHFQRKDSSQSKENFNLQPDVYLMKGNSMSSNPDTKNYLDKDVFTYISFALSDQMNRDTGAFHIMEVKPGDTAFYDQGYVILDQVIRNPDNEKYHFNSGDVAMAADVRIFDKDGKMIKAQPAIQVDNFGIVNLDDTLYAQNMFVRFAGVDTSGRIKLGVKTSNGIIDFVTVKAYVFPWINLVWLGLVIMALGVMLSMLQRLNASFMIRAISLSAAGIAIFYLFLFANT